MHKINSEYSNNYYNYLQIFAANCSAPITTNVGVVIEPYNNTVEGAVIYFNCDDGFIPNERGWLFVKAMVNGVLKFQVSLLIVVLN